MNATSELDERATEATIRTEALEKHFYPGAGTLQSLLPWFDPDEEVIPAVDGVSLAIEPGEVYGLVGESGSGKSTLGETMIRLQEPTGGEIYYRGESVNDYSRGELREFRREAQMIFQDPYECLNPRHTVYQTIADPVKNFENPTREELEDRCAQILHDVGLRPPEEFLDVYPNQLSGGQRQRVNIARSLILEPNLIIADEPVSMLDLTTQSALIKLLDRLQDQHGFSMLFISHNLKIVQIVADRIGVMYRGRIVEEGTDEAVLADPKHPYTQLLVDSIPDPGRERERYSIEGDPEEAVDPAAIEGCRFHPLCPKRFDHCTEADPALAPSEDGRDVACFLYHEEEVA